MAANTDPNAADPNGDPASASHRFPEELRKLIYGFAAPDGGPVLIQAGMNHRLNAIPAISQICSSARKVAMEQYLPNSTFVFRLHSSTDLEYARNWLKLNLDDKAAAMLTKIIIIRYGTSCLKGRCTARIEVAVDLDMSPEPYTVQVVNGCVRGRRTHEMARKSVEDDVKEMLFEKGTGARREVSRASLTALLEVLWRSFDFGF